MGGIWGPIGHALTQAKNGKKAKVAYVSATSANHMFSGIRSSAMLQHLRQALARVVDEVPQMKRDSLHLSKPGSPSTMKLGAGGPKAHPPAAGPKGAGPKPAAGQHGAKPAAHFPVNDMKLIAAEKELKEALAIERADMRALDKRLSNWRTQKEHNNRHHDRLKADKTYGAAWSRAKAAIERISGHRKGAIEGNAASRIELARGMRELSGALADMAGAG